MSKRLIFLYLLIPVLVIVAILGVLGLPNSGQTNLEKDNAGRKSTRQASFVACLEENGDDEQACIKKMNINAWYPRDETECLAVAERINAVFTVGGLPRWPTLFRNERCARLDMPHHEEAAAAGTRDYRDRSYVDCYNVDYNHIVCGDIHGRHRRYPRSVKDCDAVGSMLSRVLGRSHWESNFENERCWRLGLPHYEAD